MNPTIKDWLKLHTPTAQTFSAAWIALTTLWETNGPFHDYIKGAFDSLPKGIHAFAIGALIPILVLWRSQRKSVAVVEAAPGETGSATAKATVTGSVLLLALLVGGLSGCGVKTTSVTPPAATAPAVGPYQRAASLMLDFSIDINQVQQIEATLNQAGKIPPATHEVSKNAFIAIGQYGKEINDLIRTQATSTTIQGKIEAALQKLAIVTVMTGTLDAATTAKLQSAIQLVTVILNNVSNTFNNQVSYGSESTFSPGRSADFFVGVATLQPVQGTAIGAGLTGRIARRLHHFDARAS